MRPLPSKAICAGSSMSGSVSTGSSLKPGGSQNRFACSAGVSGWTGGFFEKSGSHIGAPRPPARPRPAGSAGGAPCAGGWAAGAVGAAAAAFGQQSQCRRCDGDGNAV